MKNTNICNFVHLHVHTQYSLLDGAIRVVDLFRRAKNYKMEAVAMTDHGTMFGVIDFYKQGVEAGVKPIIGCECYLAPRSIQNKTPMDRGKINHIVLLAKNREGYKNLCQLVSIAQMEGFYYKPRIDKNLLKKYSKGLICLSACLKGEIPQLILSNHIDKAEQAIFSYLDIFGENNFFLEIQKNNLKAQEKINNTLIELGKKFSVPLVATNDCHYLDVSDAKAHEVLLCIQTQKNINDPNRLIFDSDEFYFKSAKRMMEQFSSLPEAIDNSVKIANQCNLDFDFTNYHFPHYDSDSGKSVDNLFVEKVYDGYLERLKIIESKKDELFDRKLYDKRLDYEIRTIKSMGFSSYFLIVADFINYAKKNNISVGPGRGSAAGSLVSYSLNITDLDPISHGLIFERFLNPGRVSMPDIDVDFCIYGRERIYDYVVKRYGGSDYVAQIITFGTMKAKMVIRDVGKALGIPFREVDLIAKLIPEELGITISTALKEEPRLKEKIKSDAKFTELIKISRALEGLFRHASTHAAGVVISDKPLVNYLPLYKGKKGETVTQFDMKNVETIGLVKFDFLGLRNLTVIDNTLDLIKKQGKIAPDLSILDLEDIKTYKLLQKGNTTGVFQLESEGMKNLMIKLKVENFNEIIALVALYRPGPLDSGMVTDFVERKHGKKEVEYPIDALKPILKETYGVIVYQEQVMQIAVDLAGYSMSDADSLRQAIGKKKVSLMSEHRDRFINGAIKKGIRSSKASELFDLIEKFGGYGFNKSHSAAYALITYHTAYLKAHYPVEFMAALLTSEADNIEGIVKFIDECKLQNIEILSPDINESYKNFTVGNEKIRFGLAAIKNVGSSAVEAIIKERQIGGIFKSIFDFCMRVDLTKVNKRVIESLIYCGALGFSKIKRSRLIAALENILDYAQRFQKEKKSNQMTLFNSSKSKDNNLNQPSIPVVNDWTIEKKLELEKEYVGFYFSGHPLDGYSEILTRFTNSNTLSIKNKRDKVSVRIGGIIEDLRVIRTKKGELMAFIILGDTFGKIEGVIFPKIYSKYLDLLVKDKVVILEGYTKFEKNNVKILANSIVSSKNIEKTWKISIHINIDSEKTDKSGLLEVYDILMEYPGNCSGFLHIKMKDKGEAVLSMSDIVNIRCCNEMIDRVNSSLGYNAIETKFVHSYSNSNY